MATKRVLAIHDMCSFGRCSLTAAIPVISAMGFQVCPFPTAIFSNNLTYGDYTFSDFTPHMTEFMDKWQKLGYSYDAIYSGFLADAGQIAIVLDAIARFAKKDTLVVVDPAMADDGKLYPVFKPDIVMEMRKLIAKATIITPNYTEAALLADIPYAQGAPSMKTMLELCQKLAAMGPRQSSSPVSPRTTKRLPSSATMPKRRLSTNVPSTASPSAPAAQATSSPASSQVPCSRASPCTTASKRPRSS